MAKENQDEFQEDEDDIASIASEGFEKVFHRSLICCNNLKMGDWILEVRKTYCKDEETLKLELFKFSN